MKNEKLSTSDFVAAGERAEERQRAQDAGIGVEQSDIFAAGTSGGGARMVKEQAPAPLFTSSECETFRSRWDRIQIGFVDEPRKSVEDADNLVADTMKRLAEVFADERTKMEEQWSAGGDVSTEDLQLALQRYRSFFNRLLTF
jgi:hypothetical protein